MKKYVKNFGGPFHGEEDFKPCYLAADVEQVLEQCYHMIDQLQANLGTGSLLKADATSLLERLR